MAASAGIGEEMEIPKRFKVLDGTSLKLIAMASMVLDHVGDNFFPDQVWMRVLGRIAMPIFAFCISEGFAHTHDRQRYLMRMGIFALVSEVPFDLVTAGVPLEFSHQNIMFTFFWAILGLMLFERIAGEGAPKSRMAAGYIMLAVFTMTSVLLGLDYNMLGCGLIFVFYLLRERGILIATAAAAVFHVALRNVGIYWFGLLGFLPILSYNGQRGRGLKWLFYLFYPGHLLLIWLVRTMLG